MSEHPEPDTRIIDEPDASDPRLRDVPRGALALAGLTVGLLLLAWFFFYLFIFLPRGMVG